MKKGVLVGSLAVLLMFCAITNASSSRNLEVVNSTGHPVKYFSINQSGDKEWSENELSAVLEDKQNFTIALEDAGKGCTWNIKVMWADKNSFSIYKDVNLCKAKVLSLKYDGKTDTPTFTTK